MSRMPKPSFSAVRLHLPLAALLITLLIGSLPIQAAPLPAPAWRAVDQADGVRLEWSLPPHWRAAPTGAAGAWLDLPAAEIGGFVLPAQLVTLRAADAAAVVPQIDHLESIPWRGSLPATAAPDFAIDAAPDPALPEAPVVVLREGRLRGARLVVIAISPLFVQHGDLRVATALRATIPAASLLTDSAATLLAHSGPFLAAGPPPTNPAAARNAITIAVEQPGMQTVSRVALAAAGLDLATIDPALLHLQTGGVAVALEAASDAIRFYAPAAGDRWNRTTTYWLTLETTPGARMPVRDATPRSEPPAAMRADALERGVWRDNRLYDSRRPGPNGDHWYAAELGAGPDLEPERLVVTLPPGLPLAPGSVALTVNGTALTGGAQTLNATMGAATQTSQWSGAGDWSATFALAANQPEVQLAPGAGPTPTVLLINQIAWERPVTLDFAGNGGRFAGHAGTWRYQLSNLPADFALYDVSAPTRPQRLTGVGPVFEDGPAPRAYLLAGPGTLHTPTVTAHSPIDMASPLNTQALYIAPAALEAALAPLVALRQAQGYTTRVIPVEAIYNAWSFGQVEPAAIRDFLRYAAAAWETPPLAVTLVGDGSYDPHDYSGKGPDHVNLIPPYLAPIDRILGTTACDTCYAQLDGADPIARGQDILPDLLIGRLPVKNVAELEALVAKLVGYETNVGDSGWRSRAVYIADDPDNGGDFALFADAGAALLPPGVAVERIYYDPAGSGLPGRNADAAVAHNRVLDAFNAGAGLITYVGHGSLFQWAATGVATPPHLLSLYDPDGFRNGGRLPIVLTMTCWTSAFHNPAVSGTMIDERLLLAPNGGAAGVWGSTGTAVLYGHFWLQRGFLRALWDAGSTPMGGTTPPHLGALTTAGFLELFSQGGCCQSAIQTYVLLGDPLTVAQVRAGAERIYLPLTRR